MIEQINQEFSLKVQITRFIGRLRSLEKARWMDLFTMAMRAPLENLEELILDRSYLYIAKSQICPQHGPFNAVSIYALFFNSICLSI